MKLLIYLLVCVYIHSYIFSILGISISAAFIDDDDDVLKGNPSYLNKIVNTIDGEIRLEDTPVPSFALKLLIHPSF